MIAYYNMLGVAYYNRTNVYYFKCNRVAQWLNKDLNQSITVIFSFELDTYLEESTKR